MGNRANSKPIGVTKQNMISVISLYENPKSMKNEYSEFIQVGKLTFVKYLQGNEKTDEQLILYKSKEKMYEVKRIFYPKSYKDINKLFENLPTEIQKFLEKNIHEFNRMKISGLSLHGISPITFNIRSVPHADFNYLYCEFIFESFSTTLKKMIKRINLPPKEPGALSLRALNIFMQTLEALIFLKETGVLANINLLKDVLIEYYTNNEIIIKIRNINQTIESYFNSHSLISSNNNIENYLKESKIDDYSRLEEKRFSDLVQELSFIILKIFNWPKQFEKNLKLEEMKNENNGKLIEFLNLFQNEISSETDYLYLEIFTIIKKSLLESEITIDKAEMILNELQTIGNPYQVRDFSKSLEFANLKKENGLLSQCEVKLIETLSPSKRTSVKLALKQLNSSELIPEDIKEDSAKSVEHLLENSKLLIGLKKELEELKKQYSELKVENKKVIEELKEKNIKLEEATKEIEESKKKNFDLEYKIKELKSTIEKELIEKRSIQSDLNSIKVGQTGVMDQINEYTNQIEKMNQENNQLKLDLDNEKNLKEKLIKDFEEAREIDLQNKETQINDYKCRLVQLEDQFNQKLEQFEISEKAWQDKFEAQEGENKKMSQESEGLKNIRKQLEEKLEQYEISEKAWQEKFEAQECENKKMNQESECLKNIQKQLEEKLGLNEQTSNEMNSEIESLRTQKMQLEMNCKQMEDESNFLNSKISELEKANISLGNEVSNRDEKLTTLQNQFNQKIVRIKQYYKSGVEEIKQVLMNVLNSNLNLSKINQMKNSFDNENSKNPNTLTDQVIQGEPIQTKGVHNQAFPEEDNKLNITDPNNKPRDASEIPNPQLPNKNVAQAEPNDKNGQSDNFTSSTYCKSDESSIHFHPTISKKSNNSPPPNKENNNKPEKKETPNTLEIELNFCLQKIEKLISDFEMDNIIIKESNPVIEVQNEFLSILRTNISFMRSGVDKTLFPKLIEFTEKISKIYQASNESDPNVILKLFNSIKEIQNLGASKIDRKQYKDGSEFIGFIVNKSKEGLGILIDVTYKTKYFGFFMKNAFNGTGLLIDENSPGNRTIYFAEFVNDIMKGNGSILFSSSNFYMGNLENKIINGEGTLFYPDGSIYKGNFINGIKENFGVHQFSDNSKYEGNWNNNMMNGKGKFYSKDRKETYEGGFKEGKFHGKMTHIKNSQITYEMYDSGTILLPMPPSKTQENVGNYRHSVNIPQYSNQFNPNISSSIFQNSTSQNNPRSSNEDSRIQSSKASTKK